jgi:hypothetical protein
MTLSGIVSLAANWELVAQPGWTTPGARDQIIAPGATRFVISWTAGDVSRSGLQRPGPRYFPR